MLRTKISPSILMSAALVLIGIVAFWFVLRGAQPSIAPVIDEKENIYGSDSTGASNININGGNASAPINGGTSEATLPPLGSIVSKSGNIVLDSPLSGEEVSSPMLVSGKARVFENTINIRVKNTQGNVLIEELATAHASDAGQFGDFSVNIEFSFGSTKEGTLEVYSISAKDGSEQDLVSIPITFQ